MAEDTSSRAQELKERGNDAFRDGKFISAIDLYSQAIELCPTAINFSNRAMAHLKLENYGSAICDAEEAIKLDPEYIKAYYRRGSANFALGKYKDALADFKSVCKMKPKDADANSKFKECQKRLKEAAFAAAIQNEETLPVSQTIQVEEIVVEPEYDGPHLPGNIGEIDLDFIMAMIDRFHDQKLIHRKYVIKILLGIRQLLSTLPTLVNIELPPTDEGRITVCGDTHGQFYDVLNIFKMNGYPSPENPYLFNGDFVDRGSFSFEVVITYFAFKLLYPNAIHLLRGNHESKTMNKIYGFEGEIRAKYNETIMSLFSEVFNFLPLAGVIENKVFVVHGGLPENPMVSLDEIRRINRNREPPDTGLMMDLLWADPHPFPGTAPSKRGLGKSFGPDITAGFLAYNDLKLVVRSHEVKDEGYVVEHDGKCITVFSAPNYCDQMGNKGAFIHFYRDMEPRFQQFEAVPHPPIRPMAYASGAGMFGL